MKENKYFLQLIKNWFQNGKNCFAQCKEEIPPKVRHGLYKFIADNLSMELLQGDTELNICLSAYVPFVESSPMFWISQVEYVFEKKLNESFYIVEQLIDNPHDEVSRIEYVLKNRKDLLFPLACIQMLGSFQFLKESFSEMEGVFKNSIVNNLQV